MRESKMASISSSLTVGPAMSATTIASIYSSTFSKPFSKARARSRGWRLSARLILSAAISFIVPSKKKKRATPVARFGKTRFNHPLNRLFHIRHRNRGLGQRSLQIQVLGEGVELGFHG